MNINNVNQIKPIVNSDIRSAQTKQVEAGSKIDIPFNQGSGSEQIKTGSVDTNRKIDDEKELVDNSIDQANKTLKQFHRVIERSIHETTKSVMYTIKDTDTNEVIAEFPPKKIQDMIAKMWELAGLFVDEKA